MIYSGNFSVVLDACVLYPAPVRDILLCIAQEELFRPKWSNIIMNEWTRNLLKNRIDLSEERLERTVRAMNIAFPDAMVSSFENLINAVVLPDLNDRHVVAAAIRCQADSIITFNLKDFPRKVMKELGIQAIHPDNFICQLMELDKDACIKAFVSQVNRLNNPPRKQIDVLNTFEKCGLVQSSELLMEELILNYQKL